MSDLILRSTTRAKVARHCAKTALVDFSRRTAERLNREQTGQDMVEYAGVLVIVAIIIMAVVGIADSGIAQPIIHGIESRISSIFGGGGGGTGGGAGTGTGG
jgi:hypothetical protein